MESPVGDERGDIEDASQSLKIHCKYDALVPPYKLKAHPQNRNEHPEEQIARLAKILKYQGFRAPIVLSKLSGYIVKGHGTKEAAWLCGYQRVPVVYQEFESEEQEYLFLQSDNAIQNWSDLDLKHIHMDIQTIGPFDLELLGMEGFTLAPDEDEEKPKKKKKTCPNCGEEL